MAAVLRMTDGCLGTDTLVDFVEGRANAEERAAVARHASRCAECRRLLSSLAPETPKDAVAAAELPSRSRTLAPGDTVGRYVLAHPRTDTDAFDLAWLNGLYGRALVESGRDRAKGLALVRTACATVRAEPRAVQERAELERWLREH